MNNLWIGIALALAPGIIGIILPRRKTYGLGVKIGVLLSKLLREKLGKRTEDRIEETLIDFSEGLREGLKSEIIIQEMKKKGFSKNVIKEQKEVLKEIVKVKSEDLV